MQMVTERRQERLLHKTDFMSRAVSRDRETFVLCCFYNILLFILFLAVLGLCCYLGFSLVVAGRGYSLVTTWELLIAVASLVIEPRLWVCILQQLLHMGSVVVAPGLQNTGSVFVAQGLSCSAACGIFPDQGLNPCRLRWQAGSSPSEPPGKPKKYVTC